MLSSLSNKATVWVFQSDRKLSSVDIEAINKHLEVFIPEWSAHGTNLKAAYEVVYDFFIIVGVDEDLAEASGCSKDGLTRAIKLVGEQINVDFFNRLNTAYIDEMDRIQLVNMIEFKTLVQADKINRGTKVFNNLITTKEELESVWQVKLKDSWHANLVPVL